MNKKISQSNFLNIALVISCFIMFIFLFLALVAIRFNTSYAIQPRSLKSPTFSLTDRRMELKILPTNSDILLNIPRESISAQNITELLNDGHTSINNTNDMIISTDTPLLLNSETIYEYFVGSFHEDSIVVDTSINHEIERIYERAQKVLPLAYLISTGQERSVMKNLYSKEITYENVTGSERQVLHKLLNLTGEKTRYWELLELKYLIRKEDRAYTDQQQPIELYSTFNEEHNYENNPIYLEYNDHFYNNLHDHLSYLISHLENMGLANDKHEEIISDIRRLIDKDVTVYPKIFSMQYPYVLLHAMDENLLTVSTTPSRRQNNPVDNNNFNDELAIGPTDQESGTVRVPVLMYHNIAHPPSNGTKFVNSLYLSPESFEEQVTYLTKHNYRTIDSEEFYEILSAGNNPEQKTVMLTFDDSTRSHYTQAYPILKKYRQKGTFFVVSRYSTINPQELREMSTNGMDIQSHTINHYILPTLRSEAVIRSELQGSREMIQNTSGSSVTAIAYPGCVADSRVLRNMDGYKLGFSCGKSIDHSYDKRFMISRPLAPFTLSEMDMILSGIYPHDN